jgi:molybdopterin molybdotransferase
MMEPLPSDCFDYGRGHISLAAALDLLRSRLFPLTDTEFVPLLEAAGRVLARPLTSPRPVPAFDNAAVDGFAFAAASQPRDGPVRLTLAADRAAAGHPAVDAVPPGHAIRVLTGAVLPRGTDTVAMSEEVQVERSIVVLPRPLPPNSNRRRAGEDVRAGQELFGEGVLLRPMHLGVAAELGLDKLPVFRRLRVALHSSGDELRAPGSVLDEGGVFDANRFMLRALLRQLPVDVADRGILPDSAETVRAALLDSAEDHDVILTSGGASKGDEDHVVRTVEEHGRLDFWQVAMKPGRPLAFGRLGRAVTIGLPGNPVAAAVCFMRLARPVIARLAGSEWLEPQAFSVAAAFRLEKKPGRTELLRARLIRSDAAGMPKAELVRRQGSGILTSLTDADGLIEVDPEVTLIEQGEPVRFLSFAELGAA